MKSEENKTNPFANFDDVEWFRQRGRMYSKIAKSLPEISEVYVDLQRKVDYGWQDMDFYINGKKKARLTLSEVFDPFSDMKEWMENVITESLKIHRLFIDMEGAYYYLCYERIDFNIGLFYCFDDKKEKMLFYCTCYKSQMISAIYSAMQRWHNKILIFNEIWDNGIYELSTDCEWENKISDDEENSNYKLDNIEEYWKFYNNDFKSPLIEYACFRDIAHHNLTVNDLFIERIDKECSCSVLSYVSNEYFKTVPIKERIHMFPDYADALFWNEGGSCIGDVYSISTKTAGEIHLDIAGLTEWHEEFENHSPYSKKKLPKKWYKKGETLAREIRKILPDHIELYYDWLQYNLENQKIRNWTPKIVFNNRLLKNSNDSE